MIMHVDATCDLVNRRCCVGVVLRNKRGQLVLALQQESPTFTSSLCAEVVAVLEGIKIACHNVVQRLTIFSDSLSLISILRKTERSAMDCATMVWDIEHLRDSFHQINFCHVNSEFNLLSHQLARACLSSTPGVWNSNFPDWVVRLKNE